MSERKFNPAFPGAVIRNTGHPNHPFERLYFSGMELRDYFAGKAFGMLMHPEAKDFSPEETARQAYRFADAMLKVRDES